MSFWVLQGIACTRLTYEIYKRCKGFLKYFRNTSQVIWSLRIELEKLTEICCGAAFRQTIYRDGRLEVVVSRMSVQDILMSMQDILGRELNNLVKKFMSTWDRSGWGSKDISHLVSRLFITTIKRELHRAFPLWSRDHDGSRMTAQDQSFTSLSNQKIRRGLRGLVNGFKVSAIADSGADRNVVTAAFAKRRSLEIEGSPAIFKLGNSTFVQSLGVVRMMWSFAENPQEKVEVLCDVLSKGTYDVILGCGFLKATKTMSKHRYRLTKCFFPSTNLPGMNFLGGGTQRLKGIVGSSHQTLAVPDSGADRNVMDLGYAQNHGFEIQTHPENCGYLQFADGSFQQTVGQVTTTWTFENGECIPVTFEILQHCCSDVILGDDILWERDVFGRHSSSLVDAASSDEALDLAPFGYLRKWQKKIDSLFHKEPTPESNPLNNSQRIEAGERRRRDRWNFQYGFGGHKASPAEQEAEKQRRIRYRNNGRIPRIPSIPTSADLMEGLSNNGI